MWIKCSDHESVTGLASERRILRGLPDRDASAALVGFGGFNAFFTKSKRPKK